MIDNYDSFTYNVVRSFRELGADISVVKNDQLSVKQIEQIKPSAILISPGPGTPEQAGICLALIKHFAGKLPMLGVCLGHQCIAQAFGGKIVRASQVMHGKTSAIYHLQTGVFAGLPSPFRAARYHSLLVEEGSLPKELEVSATVKYRHGSEIMAIKHRSLPIEGVQFHPEAILSEHGLTIFSNFLQQI